MAGDLGADVSAGPGAVFHHELPTQRFGEPLSDQAGEHVRGPAGGEGNDQPHRLCGVGLRERGARAIDRTSPQRSLILLIVFDAIA